MAFRINAEDRPPVLEQNRRRMSEVLPRFFVDDGLASLLTGQVEKGNGDIGKNILAGLDARRGNGQTENEDGENEDVHSGIIKRERPSRNLTAAGASVFAAKARPLTQLSLGRTARIRIEYKTKE